MNLRLRNNFRRRVLGMLCASALAATGCGSSVQALLGLDETSAVCMVPGNASELADQVVQLINEERALRGLNPLERSEELSRFGAGYACRMIEDGFFGHEDPRSGQDFADRHATSDFRSCYLGENLALGYGTPEAVLEAWMDSPSHRNNILDDGFSRIGLSIRQDSLDQRIYWVEMFLGECEEQIVPASDPGDVTTALSPRPSLPQGSTQQHLVQPPPPVGLTTGSVDPPAVE